MSRNKNKPPRLNPIAATPRQAASHGYDPTGYWARERGNGLSLPAPPNWATPKKPGPPRKPL